jgi:diaminohydroxyphosphoribosylaminopyrimidine deaminase/5-amino-6-(5-phosphoribosylamino)uracil reductase
MTRAMELAALGQGLVSPNPMVGCVIVFEGRIVGEGWHRKYGEAHAEVNAVNSVADKSVLRESTVYVTLEPCSHFGKTPPCADMLIREGVKKIIVANVDPNPIVGGSGIKKISDAGIEIVTGLLSEKGENLNKRFFWCMRNQMPFVILKWAQTSDGFIARENFDSKWISDGFSRQLVHKWRADEDAILVGSSTALYDNPTLTVRDWTGNNPIRVVIDRNLKLPDTLNLFDKSQLTICYNLIKNQQDKNIEFVKIDEEDFIRAILKDLYNRKIQSVIIEGGSQTLNAFIKAGLWNEARVFTSTQKFEKGIKAPVLHHNAEEEILRSDILRTYRNS